MFTGIIEEIGTVIEVKNDKITIQSSTIMSDMVLGSSIAVNGVCLTVTEKANFSFSAQISPETKTKTTLSGLCVHQKVNLERAMPVNGRFGGHIVLGHVDGIGIIERIVEQGKFSLWYFKVPYEICKYIVPKGSIAIDGISLTVIEIIDNIFSVAIIPSTRSNTNLQFLNIGNKVNLETDIIGKYIERLLGLHYQRPALSENFLKEHGFLE